jgi:hypothetical protein
VKLQVDITADNLDWALLALREINDKLRDDETRGTITGYASERATGLFELLDSQPAGE